MDDYIAKPVRADEVALILERWVPRRPAAAEPPAAAPAAVDADAVTVLAGGDAALLAELVDMFNRETPARLDAIRAAVKRADADELRRAAHLLKGEAKALYVSEVADLAADLEALGRSGSVDGARERLAALELAVQRARTALEALRGAGLPRS